MLNSNTNKILHPKADGLSLLMGVEPQFDSFTSELAALMKRHGISEHVVVYTLLSAGSILSYTSNSALIEAGGLISARVHAIKSRQS